MSSLNELAKPSWWRWPRTGETPQKFGIFTAPNYPKGITLPSGKKAIMEYVEDYSAALAAGGLPRISEYGATEWSRFMYGTGVDISGKSGAGGVVGDGWSTVGGYRSSGQYLSAVSNLTGFRADFLAHVLTYFGGTDANDFNYDAMILNGEDWIATADNSAGSKTVTDGLVAEMAAWNPGGKKLGIWAVSGAIDNIRDLTAGNLATKNTAYKTGGSKSIYADSGFDLLVPLRYILNNTAISFYDWVYTSDIAKRINPSKKEIWSVWSLEEHIDGYGGEYATRNSRTVHGYVKTDLSDGSYFHRPVPHPPLFFYACLLGYMVYDGVYQFGYLKATHDKSHIVTNGGELVSTTVGGEGVIYEDFMAIMDWDYLARYYAHQEKSIIEAATDWIIPEFSVDGGSTWITGDDRLPANCQLNSLPIIKMKYNATSSPTEALILAMNPTLNSPGNWTQSVRIRDTAEGVDNTFTLKSVTPYLGKLNV